ncbi:MAG: hypothetical protein HY611_04440 [Elusimicrobia bacterium]|nr:hypothetical protein [Elusimicrobiota bacterium]
MGRQPGNRDTIFAPDILLRGPGRSGEEGPAQQNASNYASPSTVKSQLLRVLTRCSRYPGGHELPTRALIFVERLEDIPGQNTRGALGPRIKALRQEIEAAEEQKREIIAQEASPLKVSGAEVRRCVEDLRELLAEGTLMERKS